MVKSKWGKVNLGVVVTRRLRVEVVRGLFVKNKTFLRFFTPISQSRVISDKLKSDLFNTHKIKSPINARWTETPVSFPIFFLGVMV